MVEFLEERVGRQMTDGERRKLVHGADEHDLVYSGLEDTMIQACAETRNTANAQVRKVWWDFLDFALESVPSHGRLPQLHQ